MTNNKIALITGASRGLGRSSALHLARRGVNIIGTYNSNREAAESMKAEVEAAGAKALVLHLDVSSSASFSDFAGAVGAGLKETFGRDTFDFLMNNAGIAHSAPIAEIQEADFDRLVAIHLKAPFFLTQKLLGLLADGGRVVNISSGLARFALPGYAAYASMKGGIEVFTRYLAKELGERQITVNTLAPGAIETDFGGGGVRDNPDVNAWVASLTALGRAGRPDDIGGAVAALFAGDTAWVNGQRIEASGGMFV